MNLSVIVNRLYVIRTQKYEFNDLLEVFNKSFQEAILQVIESGTNIKFNDNLVLTTMRIRSIQFNNAIYNKRIADLEKIPDGGFAWCIVFQSKDGLHYYVDIPTPLYANMYKNISKSTYNDGFKDFSKLRAISFNDIVKKQLKDKPKLPFRSDIIVREFMDLFQPYLCDRLQNIEFDSDYGTVDIQPYAPPRGLSKYNYNKDIKLFDGIYYIPIEYTESLLLKKDWMLNGVLVTTNLKTAQRYSKYVIKAYSKTFIGNLFVADNFVINKYELLNFE